MHHPQPNLAAAAALFADPARAAMLMMLMDGRARPAGELAHAAGVTAQTASSHLAKLLVGEVLAVEREGRHRYYRLAGAHVAHILEHLAIIGPAQPVRRKPLSKEAQHLRCARRCYDHLAGQLGVAVTRALEGRGVIMPAPDTFRHTSGNTQQADKQYVVTPAGRAWLRDFGLDVDTVKVTRRGLARQCLDWTERLHHLAGPLGVEFMRLLCAKGWLVRSRASRAMTVTPAGWAGLKRTLGIDRTAL